jgi:hypothetical protein
VRYLGHSDGDNFLLHSILFIVLFQISNWNLVNIFIFSAEGHVVSV